MEILADTIQKALEFIKMIRVTDVIDIAVMAFLIYKILMMVRRSNSGRVVKGIILVFVALGLSSIFHLYGINFILSRLVEWGVLALVILFQPEIRRFLERMGGSWFGNAISHGLLGRQEESDELDRAISQTVEAYTALSKDKVGALMVFERNNLLDDAIKTGTPLDCSVSAELLKNLFWNKAPLHDGAVIVRGGRIVGAGCMLPLSGNVNLSRDLGMRHRAGIGISEHSDAVVAIVSEETGSISVAIDGMLKRHLAPETLDRLLRKELMPVPEDTPKTPKDRIAELFKTKRGEETNGKA